MTVLYCDVSTILSMKISPPKTQPDSLRCLNHIGPTSFSGISKVGPPQILLVMRWKLNNTVLEVLNIRKSQLQILATCISLDTPVSSWFLWIFFEAYWYAGVIRASLSIKEPYVWVKTFRQPPISEFNCTQLDAGSSMTFLCFNILPWHPASFDTIREYVS